MEAVTLLVFDVEQLTDDQLDEVRDQIVGQQYLVLSTHSDRLNSRCLRFIFPLSHPVSPDAWVLFWHAARHKLVSIADPASADVARVYFLPSCPSDASYFLQVNEGSVLDVDAVLASASAYPSQVTASRCPTEGEVSP